MYKYRSDASLIGWGATEMSSNRHASGRWKTQESLMSINILELLAIFYALQSFYVNCRKIHIQVESDNVSAVKYVNDMGGMASKTMDSIAKDIWEWCIKREIFLSAVHVPGVENTVADYFSRHFSDSTEWFLKQEVFHRVCANFFKPDIDLFASRLNAQLDRFVSWFAEPGATYVNAFSLTWSDFAPYIFPPFSLIGQVLNKLKRDKVEKAILVFPLWRSQIWFLMVMEMLYTFPVRLPRHRDLMVLPHNSQNHPLSKRINMVAAGVSGNPFKIKDFLSRLLISSSTHGDQGLKSNTILHGGSGIFGVCAGKVIPLSQLK